MKINNWESHSLIISKKLKNVNFIELTEHILKLVLKSNLKRISIVQELEELMEKPMMKEDISTQKKVKTNLVKFKKLSEEK